jgi:hypothetical protein
MTAPDAVAPSAEQDPLRMVPLLLMPRLARPGANCHALALLGRLACVDTGLRDAAREQLAPRRASQAADAARADELERAIVAVSRHIGCACMMHEHVQDCICMAHPLAKRGSKMARKARSPFGFEVVGLFECQNCLEFTP